MKKTLFITGGSSGIGKAICELFTEDGYQVLNFDIQAGDCGDWIDADVTQHEKIQELIKHKAEQHSPSVFIANAGKHLSASLENTDESQFDDLMALNLKSAYSVSQAVLPSMQKAAFGRIIFIGSDQSMIAKSSSFAYCVSKHGLAAMAKSIALDYARFGITANLIGPGTIDTPLYRKAIEQYSQRSGIPLSEIEQAEAAEQPVNRIGQASEVAKLALFLAAPSSGFITGSLQMIDGGYTAK